MRPVPVCLLLAALWVSIALPARAAEAQSGGKVEVRAFQVTDNRPARQWDHAYPVGNGRLGAMPFGDYPNEQVLLNEETIWGGRDSKHNSTESQFIIEDVRRLLWAGEYQKAQDKINRDFLVPETPPRTFQPMGYLKLKYKTDAGAGIKNYRRTLSMNEALAGASFETADGNLIREEVFSFHPDDLIIVHFESRNKGACP